MVERWGILTFRNMEDLPLENTFTPLAREIFSFAGEEAARAAVGPVDPSFILLGMLRVEEDPTGKILQEAGLRLRPIRKKIRALLPPGGKEETRGFSPLLEQAITLAYGLTVQMGHELVGVEHLLLALLAVEDPLLVRLFKEESVDPDALSRSLLKAMEVM